MHNKVLTNVLWRFFERAGAQGVKLILEIILARLLLPDDYGLIALVTVFITILNVFVDSGLGNALIQKKDADDLDFSSVFWFNIVCCILMYFFLFLNAPLISYIFKSDQLTSLLRVLGFQVIISGVKNVEQAYVSRTMQFKRFFFATLGGTVGAAIIGIMMAYRGFGVWSLVIQQLFNVLVDTIILWITVKWRPKRIFSLQRLKGLFSYGWKLLVSALIDTVYMEIRQLIIGAKYSSSDLAFYNRGRQFPYLFISNVNAAIDSVLLPTLSKEQDNIIRVKNMTRKSIQVSVYILAPCMMFLSFSGEQIVRLLLTEKWLPCLTFMRIFCMTFMFYPIHTANLNAIKALGRSDLFLKLEIAKKIVGLTALFITMNIGVKAMAYSLLFVSVLSQIINSWPNNRLLNYGYIEQLKDIIPGILLAVLMGVIIMPIGMLGINDITTIILQFILGVIVYFIGSHLLKLEGFQFFKSMMKNFKNK